MEAPAAEYQGPCQRTTPRKLDEPERASLCDPVWIESGEAKVGRATACLAPHTLASCSSRETYFVAELHRSTVQMHAGDTSILGTNSRGFLKQQGFIK